MAGSKFRNYLAKQKAVKDSVELKTTQTNDAAYAESISEEELNKLLKNLNEEEPKPLIEQANDVVAVLQTVVAILSEPVKKHKAYNTYWDSSKKKFMLVTIEYDPKSFVTELLSIEPYADSQPTALFKLNNLNTMKIVKGEEKI